MKPMEKAARAGRPSRREAPAPDRGTPEVQARRAMLAAGGDPALTESPLGLLRLRGQISADQQEAGSRYACLYRQAVARPHLSYERVYRELLSSPGGGEERPEERQAQMEALYRAAKRRLLKAGRPAAEITEEVAVFGRLPPTLAGPVLLGPVGRAQLAALRAGLDALSARGNTDLDNSE
jgi:hypothetical protein